MSSSTTSSSSSTPSKPRASTSTSTFTPALLAGALAGTTVDLSLYPLDTVKTRLQSRAGFLASGGFAGVYRGVGSAIVGSAPGAALFFVTYESCKTSLQRLRRGGGGGAAAAADALDHMLAASVGEVAACAVRVPTEVVKQRAQAGRHASSLLALRAILFQQPPPPPPQHRRAGGGAGARSRRLLPVVRGLYRGWGVTVLREVPFTMIQFPLWEALKAWRRRRTGRRAVGAAESALFGSAAGAVAAAATTPLDVLKTRVMLAPERTRLAELARGVMRERAGWRGFFRGLTPRVAWIAAGGAVFLGSYEWAFNLLMVEGEEREERL